MGPITAILSRPRTVVLAGVPFPVGELTLGDIADLQAYLDAGHPDPAAGLRDAVGSMAEGERRGKLLEAYKAAGQGPPCWGDARGARVLLSDEGFAELIRVATRGHRPALTGEEVAEVARNTTAAEYGALVRALVRSDPAEEIARMLGLPDEAPTGRPITWSEAVVEVAERLHKMPHELGPMTLSEFRAVRTGGKPKAVGVAVAPGKGFRRRLAEARRKWFGDDEAGADVDAKGAG